MASFSKIQQIFEWCFHPDENNEKHTQWAHPLFSFFFGIGSTVIPLVKLIDFLERKFPKLKEDFPEWATGKLPVAMIFYLAMMILARVKYFGPMALYDFLWACNISLLTLLIGLKKKSHLLISSSMILIAIDQMLWYIDVIGYVFVKKFIIGVAAFLKWPATPLIKKLTTSHHVWFIPLALAILKKSKNVTILSYLCSAFTSLILIALGRTLAPKNIKLNRGQGEELIYTNLNLSWEIWKDIKLGFLEKFESPLIF